jgi:hypothetical protein
MLDLNSDSNSDFDIELFKAPKKPKIPMMLPSTTGSAFRVNSEEYIDDVLLVYVDNKWHLVSSEIFENYEIKGVQCSDIYHAVTNDGEEFLIPVTKGWNGKGSTLSESLTEMVIAATERWICRTGFNNIAHEYEISNLNKKPKFKHTIEECLKRSLKNRLILNEDDVKKINQKKKINPVVKEIEEE